MACFVFFERMRNLLDVFIRIAAMCFSFRRIQLILWVFHRNKALNLVIQLPQEAVRRNSCVFSAPTKPTNQTTNPDME